VSALTYPKCLHYRNSKAEAQLILYDWRESEKAYSENSERREKWKTAGTVVCAVKSLVLAGVSLLVVRLIESGKRSGLWLLWMRSGRPGLEILRICF
jgi:hypothetical protein